MGLALKLSIFIWRASCRAYTIHAKPPLWVSVGAQLHLHRVDIGSLRAASALLAIIESLAGQALNTFPNPRKD